jgi:CRISPR system Cascade subunit CasD
MRDYLLFRLYGPLAAWGETAVGEVRPSAAWPGRSAILGLLAAAFGISRDEEDRHHELAENYALAICVENQGDLMRDYHTTQVPPERKGVQHLTRQDELSTESLHTILSRRDYRAEAFYTVALWCKKDDGYQTLAQVAEALKAPKFTLYLGRKSCPLALPMDPRIEQAEDLRSAFESVSFLDTEFLALLPRSEERIFVWDESNEKGMNAIHVNRRRDEPVSRKRWQFGERNEYYFSESRNSSGEKK